jgi:AhpD family alkylhydroperoxidase
MAHVNIAKAHPDVYRSMMAFHEAVVVAARQAGLDARLVELVRLRASQLNGCAYCLREHASDALALGESAERLAVLAAWWESQLYSPQERAALRLVERVTRIADAGAQVEPDAADALDDAQTSAVTWLAVAIGALNRVAISSHFPVGPSLDR